MARPQANLTGFDVKKLVASSRSAFKDPWARLYEFILPEVQQVCFLPIG